MVNIQDLARHAVFMMNGWAGYSETPCIVVGETPKRYRVKLTKQCRLPGRMRWGSKDQIVLMPKASVRIGDHDDEGDAYQ